jgi:phage tail sheath protein FI
MAVITTYPGVYIDELPSPVRTIVGVPTAVTAFVGAAARGRTDLEGPTHITSWADFERVYGGLDAGSSMSYAVYQYYLNGGSEAEIVRVLPSGPAVAATIDLGNNVILQASTPGAEGNDLQARVDYATDGTGTYTLKVRPGSDNTKIKQWSGIEPGATADKDTSLQKKVTELVSADGSEPYGGPPASPKPPKLESGEPGDEWAVPNLAHGTGGISKVGPASIELDTGDVATKVTLQAKSAGAWGNRLRARVDYKALDPSDSTSWNLTVLDTATGAVERFLSISTDSTSQRGLPRTLLASSQLVTSSDPGSHRPTESPNPTKPGADPFADPDAGNSKTYSEGSGGSDGPPLSAADLSGGDDGEEAQIGIYALIKSDIFNILCIPPPDDITDFSSVLGPALQLCLDRRAMLIVDPPDASYGNSVNPWTDVASAVSGGQTPPVTGDSTTNAAIYFPRVAMPDPLQNGVVREFAPCGVMAGVWARTDATRGVWKAPAGIDASLNGVVSPSVLMTDLENGELNPLGVNCLRTFPIIGPVAWGARTMRGADALANPWKYLPVRRTALFLEESLYRGTKWVVFEPNDEPLWSAIRLNVGAFMNTQFRQGAFQGSTAREAYLVKCDKENNPQNDIDRGIVNILVGFAPLKPAEFVIIHIEQLAGQLAT